MRDIRRPYQSSRSSGSEITKRVASSGTQKELKDISKKVEMFERGEYQDIEYTKTGKPIMKASSHFDLKPPSRHAKNLDDFDILKREAFFNSKKREFNEEDVKVYRKARNKKKKFRNTILFSILAIIVAGLISFTFFFDFAKITINPKYKDIEVSDNFLIFKDDTIVDVASSTLSKNVPKSEPKEINQKSSGEITIYNNYSEKSQTLIRNTRFQTKDGKIFRIADSIVVPGKKGNTPGSILAKVSADAYGPEYNISATDFTIPGFKGTDRYNLFYAKSSKSMTGGASGITQAVSKDDIALAKENLTDKLNIDLKDLVKDFKHDSYITFNFSPIIKYTDNQDILITSDKTSYELTGNAKVLSVKESVLAKMIAKQVLKDSYNDMEEVRFLDTSGLTFNVDKDSDLSSNIIKINVVGKARLVWVYDDLNIKKSLINKNISYLNDIIKNYKSSIISASVKFTPFWVRSFPSNINRINISEQIK